MRFNPLPAIKRVALAFILWLHVAVCALMNEEGRKAWAMIMAWGCAVAMTGYAAAVLWLVRKSPMLSFWLGLTAMLIILVVITGIMVVLGVRRDVGGKVGDLMEFNLKDGNVEVSRDGTKVAVKNESGTTAVEVSPDKGG